MPSPRKAARIRPLTVSGTLAVQVPSTAHTVPAMRANAAPGTANSMSSGAPAGEEPSGKRSWPVSLTGRVRMRVLDARTVSPASEPL